MIYSLNTKNDDLELDMQVMRTGFEDKLQKVLIFLKLITILFLKIMSESPKHSSYTFSRDVKTF